MLRAAGLAAALGAALSGSLSATALAGASISTPGKCYVYWPGQGSQTIPITLEGLTSGQQVKVELRVKGTTVSGLPSLTVGLSGTLDTSLLNWTSGLGDGPTKGAAAELVVTDFILGTELASTPIKVANVGLDIDASRKLYGTKRRWIISGLNQLSGGGSDYYAFYFKGHKQVGKQKIGHATDACGYLRTKQKLIPFTKTGTYTMKVQASTKYKSALPWIGGSVYQGLE
jgi:hypothetical protein